MLSNQLCFQIHRGFLAEFTRLHESGKELRHSPKKLRQRRARNCCLLLNAAMNGFGNREVSLQSSNGQLLDREIPLEFLLDQARIERLRAFELDLSNRFILEFIQSFVEALIASRSRQQFYHKTSNCFCVPG